MQPEIAIDTATIHEAGPHLADLPERIENNGKATIPHHYKPAPQPAPLPRFTKEHVRAAAQDIRTIACGVRMKAVERPALVADGHR